MEITSDGFLDGRFVADQPKNGFRSGVDAVLLAAAVSAKSGQSVLELGVGAGVATLCLAARVPGLDHAGLDVQADYLELAQNNAERFGIAINIFEGSVADPPKSLSALTFDHVMMNPPYYRAGAWSQSDQNDKTKALGEDAPLNSWIDFGTRRLKPGGQLTLIHKASRLVDVLAAADARLGSIQIKPVSPRRYRPAELVVVRFKKGGRADPLLHPPLIMHQGDRHKQDAAHHTDAANAILRNALALEF